MAAVAFYFPLLGTPTAAGNQLTFYEAGLDDPLDVWTDFALTIPWAQPITLNSAGEADGVIYLDSTGPSLKVVYVDQNGVNVPGYPVDDVPPGSIVNVMTTAIVTLTNAQIKALPSTPITLVAAPASGLWNKIFAVTISTRFTGHAYTGVNTTYAAVQIQTPGGQWLASAYVNDSTTTPAMLDATNLLSGVNGVFPFSIPTTFPNLPGGWQQYVTTPILRTDVGAVATNISIDNNGSGNLGGGDAANTMIVTVYYALESLS